MKKAVLLFRIKKRNIIVIVYYQTEYIFCIVFVMRDQK